VAFFDERERAALAWAESLTLVAETRAPDEVFALVRAQFDDKEIVDLSLAIAAMNAWNRFGVGFGLQPPARK
jgi:alkylhydroperoxidase family enzyme